MTSRVCASHAAAFHTATVIWTSCRLGERADSETRLPPTADAGRCRGGGSVSCGHTRGSQGEGHFVMFVQGKVRGGWGLGLGLWKEGGSALRVGVVEPLGPGGLARFSE